MTHERGIKVCKHTSRGGIRLFLCREGTDACHNVTHLCRTDTELLQTRLDGVPNMSVDPRITTHQRSRRERPRGHSIETYGCTENESTPKRTRADTLRRWNRMQYGKGRRHVSFFQTDLCSSSIHRTAASRTSEMESSNNDTTSGKCFMMALR